MSEKDSYTKKESQFEQRTESLDEMKERIRLEAQVKEKPVGALRQKSCKKV